MLEHTTSNQVIRAGKAPVELIHLKPTDPLPPVGPGDVFTQKAQLSQTGTQVGTESGRFVLGRMTAIGTIVATFDNGTLTTHGTQGDSSKGYDLTITTGTGHFAGLSGFAHYVYAPGANPNVFTEDEAVTYTFILPTRHHSSAWFFAGTAMGLVVLSAGAFVLRRARSTVQGH